MKGERSNLIPYLMVTLAFVIAVGIGQHLNSKTNKLAHQNTRLIVQENHLTSQLAGVVQDLATSKANVSQLQTINCGLKKFLALARRARYDATTKLTEPAAQKQIDITAYKGYSALIKTLDGKSYCPLTGKLHIKGEPDG